MTRPGIEPLSPGPLANIQLIWPMSLDLKLIACLDVDKTKSVNKKRILTTEF